MGTGLRLRARDAKENPAKVLAMVLFIMFIISALLLLLLALLLYRLELSEAVVKVAVIVIYIITGLTGGILMGKKRSGIKSSSGDLWQERFILEFCLPSH